MRLPVAIVSLLPLLFSTSANSEDWPQWRGAKRDGLSTETGLIDSWPPGGPPLVWTATGLGEGYSTPVISNGLAYALGADGDVESIFAVEVETGTLKWRTRSGRRYRNNRGDGPRGAPTVDGGRVYALGGRGDLSVLDAATGNAVWSVNVLDAFGGRNINWGMSESPLVLSDRVLVNAGGRGASIVALDKSDGSVLWKALDDEAGYSSAVLATIGGVRQAIFFTGERVLGIDVSDGRLLWHYRRVSNRTANVATPIVKGNFVFASSDYGTGCALLEIQGGPAEMTVREVYFTRNMKNHHSSSVLVGNTLYGFNGGILSALDFATGEVLWKDRSVGKGSLVYAEDHLYLLSEKGIVGLAAASAAGYRESGRFELPQRSRRPSWSHPVVSDGHLYLRDQDRLFKFDISR